MVLVPHWATKTLIHKWESFRFVKKIEQPTTLNYASIILLYELRVIILSWELCSHPPKLNAWNLKLCINRRKNSRIDDRWKLFTFKTQYYHYPTSEVTAIKKPKLLISTGTAMWSQFVYKFYNKTNTIISAFLWM